MDKNMLILHLHVYPVTIATYAAGAIVILQCNH